MKRRDFVALSIAATVSPLAARARRAGANHKTAKALGVTFPSDLVTLADEVIE